MSVWKIRNNVFLLSCLIFKSFLIFPGWVWLVEGSPGAPYFNGAEDVTVYSSRFQHVLKRCVNPLSTPKPVINFEHASHTNSKRFIMMTDSERCGFKNVWQEEEEEEEFAQLKLPVLTRRSSASLAAAAQPP